MWILFYVLFHSHNTLRYIDLLGDFWSGACFQARIETRVYALCQWQHIQFGEIDEKPRINFNGLSLLISIGCVWEDGAFVWFSLPEGCFRKSFRRSKCLPAIAIDFAHTLSEANGFLARTRVDLINLKTTGDPFETFCAQIQSSTLTDYK